MSEYYSVTVESTDDESLERMIQVATSMNYHRIYITESDFYEFDHNDCSQYSVEILFVDEYDATMFHLKL